MDAHVHGMMINSLKSMSSSKISKTMTKSSPVTSCPISCGNMSKGLKSLRHGDASWQLTCLSVLHGKITEVNIKETILCIARHFLAHAGLPDQLALLCALCMLPAQKAWPPGPAPIALTS